MSQRTTNYSGCAGCVLVLASAFVMAIVIGFGLQIGLGL